MAPKRETPRASHLQNKTPGKLGLTPKDDPQTAADQIQPSTSRKIQKHTKENKRRNEKESKKLDDNSKKGKYLLKLEENAKPENASTDESEPGAKPDEPEVEPSKPRDGSEKSEDPAKPEEKPDKPGGPGEPGEPGGAGTEAKWRTGEKILCFHGPLIYEAKIQSIEMQNGVAKYFIHYHGWNKHWDELVPETRMMKYTEKNAAIQKDLIRAHEEKNNEKRGRTLKRRAEDVEGEGRADHVFAVPKTPSPVPRGRRKAGLRPQRREVVKYGEPEEEEGVKKKAPEALKPPDLTVESEEIFNTKVEIRIKIPDELKSYIADDWEQITRHKNKCTLPARLTVDQLLNNYTRAKTANKSETATKNNKEIAIHEVTAGLRDYFNVMLPSQLLYKQEKAQFEQLKREDPGLVPMNVYGAPHLLRLFTKLGETLIYTPLSEKSVNILLIYIHDILNYIKKNSSIIFSNADYSSPVETESEPGSSSRS